MEAVRRAFARLGALPPRFKAGLLGLAVFSAAALGWGLNATRDARVALFATPLYADQLTEVQNRLAGWGVPYAPLADNVRVDPRKRAELLLRLSLAGIPHRHLATSDEAFARVNALTPQSVLEAQTRDALAADLAQGLRGLDGVADARVIVAPASAGAYADEPARDASASVRVTLTPGAHLAPATVAGIRAFVAGGVPGLDADRVTVLDDRGALDGGSSEPDDSSLQASLQSALDAALGAGTTIVRVHREPLGEVRDERDVKRLPLAGDLTRTSGDERYAGSKNTYQKQTATEEHGSETRDVHRSAAPDATARLSVAIFVDGARAIDLDAIRTLAAAAAGIDERRGDTLRVEAVRFAASAPATVRGIDAWAIAGLFAGLLPQLALVAGAVALAARGARPAYELFVRFVEAAGVRDTTRESAGLPPARVRGALAGEPPHVAAAVISALPAATAAAVLELYPPEERAQIVRRLARAATDLVPHPEELLRARG
ncbi:MAG TPA: flagellar M-ring protein FliF C-terminal domain-containing protein [Candidatus Lustribacter sp.]|jgi:flagellar biosynthesis/type III secretory pathway M-ring protein FliF/YscJ|nr:flagellar M-ring protein FliF C-terminal domain-containing protein [Candidatus Lustribacter sp.]